MELKLTKEAMEQIDQYSRDRGNPLPVISGVAITYTLSSICPNFFFFVLR